MFNRILVVCVGNICRSPVGERLLAARLPDVEVGSAGLGALVGHAADETAATVAAEHGISVEGHVARQFDLALAQHYDLILVMEPGHRADIVRRMPQLSGKVMLYDQWSGAKGIPDPYRKPEAYHREVLDQIIRAADVWASKLNRKTA